MTGNHCVLYYVTSLDFLLDKLQTQFSKLIVDLLTNAIRTVVLKRKEKEIELIGGFLSFPRSCDIILCNVTYCISD